MPRHGYTDILEMPKHGYTGKVGMPRHDYTAIPLKYRVRQRESSLSPIELHTPKMLTPRN